MPISELLCNFGVGFQIFIKMKDGYIARAIEPIIEEASRYFPVITLTGPRQSGKTTALRHIFKDLPYYSLENLDTRSLAADDPIRFLNLHKEGLLLDEVHHAPQLLSYIQGIVDEHPERKFILSGSSNFALLRNVSQSLAGRSGVFELLPMSLTEVKDQVSSENLDELLYQGLYPAICSGKNIAKFLYPSYIKTYLDRDVREMVNVRDMSQFNIFLRLCAGRIGSVLNATELANEVGVSTKTVQSWLSILEASYVIFLLPPYFENSRKRLTKSPKIYFCDTGLACALLGIEDADQLAYHRMRGHLFENLIVMELLKRRLNAGKESNLFFYRDSNQNEIDIVVDDSSSVSLIEVKSSMTYSSSFTKALDKADKWFNKPISRKSIVYAGSLEDPDGRIRLINYQHL